MALVSSDVPIGSGVSSSAAIELAFGVAWNELAGLGLSNIELAKAGQRCENGFIGLQSGIMDQMASAMGRGGHALFLDTRSLEIEYAPIPHGLTIVICDTGKPRALTDSAYNERRAQCEAASVAMGVATLRDATLADLEAQRPVMDPVIYRRAKHVITENARCQDFKKVLDAGDIEAIGVLMRASHESLRDDYEVSSPELDAMAEAAWVAPGCVGARMTGAGFGGACVALVREDLLAQFVQSASVAYTASSSLAGQFLPCKAVDGARALS
jgi:galactokinase